MGKRTDLNLKVLAFSFEHGEFNNATPTHGFSIISNCSNASNFT